MKNKSLFTKYLFLTISFLFLILAYLNFPELIFFLIGVGVAILSYLVWGAEEGIMAILLLASITLGMFFRSIEIFLFGLSVCVILGVTTFRLRVSISNLRKSEHKYKNLVEMASDGIVILQNRKIKYSNPSLIKMLGYSIIEVIETDFTKYVPSNEIDDFLEKYKKARSGDKDYTYDIILKNRLNKTIDTEMSFSSIDYEGEPADMIIIRDVTQRKQIEEIIHQKEQEFENLVKRSPDIIARFDNEYRYLYINSAIEKEVGIHPRDVFWKTVRNIIVPEKASQIWERSIEEVFQNKKEKTIYTGHLTPRGKRYYNTRLLPELDRYGRVGTVLAISRDITEVKEIDKIKSEFISVSSHQLRTPLSVIRWCTIMLLDGMLGEVKDEQKKYIDKIYESTKKLIKISNSFFNVAILDLGILTIITKEVNVIDIIKRTIDDLEPERVKKGIKISQKYNNIPVIKVDERLFEMVVRAIISNSIKYGYDGGNIWIEVIRQQRNILVKVSDDGYGIPKEYQAKIFTKFYRAENIKNKAIYGTGLDLYIIKEIIKNFKGDIWFESPNPDIESDNYRGTSFFFTIALEEEIKQETDQEADRNSKEIIRLK
ncbi:MAG: PAS domain S-box protein [Candidatus Pacebacteria bacterium]|nr:PAS domain S-box protein [Candidatus Paceibacterota bacterium]